MHQKCKVISFRLISRYFAIIFPTEYQRHSLQTKVGPYVVMIWVLSLATSVTIFMEDTDHPNRMCWVEDPQYLILSSLISFILPACVIVYLYLKIFRKLRKHLLLTWIRKRGSTIPANPPQVQCLATVLTASASGGNVCPRAVVVPSIDVAFEEN